MTVNTGRRPSGLDDRSFEVLYRRHIREIYRFVLRDVGNRADAEEVTQAAFLDAYRALRRGHSPEKPTAWLFGIARNATRRRYRTQSRRPREVHFDPELLEVPTAEEGTESEEIRDAVAGLRASHREVLFLREIEGLSYVEIAERMDSTRSAVETLLFRARRALRESLEEQGIRPAPDRPRRRLGGLALLPAGFLRQLDRIGLDLGRSSLGLKAASAVATVVVGTGVVAGTGALSVAAATKRAARPASVHSLVVRPVAFDAVSAALGIASASERRETARIERPKKRDRKAAAQGGTAPATDQGSSGSESVPPPSGGGSSGTAPEGQSGGTGSELPALPVPAPTVPLPDADVPDLPDADLPDADLPDADLPDADLPDAGLPDTDLPDADVPDVLSADTDPLLP